MKTLAVVLALCAFGRGGVVKVTAVGDRPEPYRVSLAAGDTLEVHLPSQPGTGYGWAVAGITGTSLRGGRPPTVQGGDGPPLAGSGAVEVFRFVAASPGEATVSFHYRRGFEKGKPPLKVRRVTATVRPPARDHSREQGPGEGR